MLVVLLATILAQSFCHYCKFIKPVGFLMDFVNAQIFYLIYKMGVKCSYII